MRGLGNNSGSSRRQTGTSHHSKPVVSHNRQVGSRKKAAYRQRVVGDFSCRSVFNAPENWHEPVWSRRTRYVVQSPGLGFVHPVSTEEVRDRLAQLPVEFTQGLDVVQFSRMSRKRANFPCYGMQWGTTIYLYPIEENLTETYQCPPKPAQQIEARMFGGTWQAQSSGVWTLHWTEETLKDFYLNNVLIHELGHINDQRNTRSEDRERFANWFAIEYGYRWSRNLVTQE